LIKYSDIGIMRKRQMDDVPLLPILWVASSKRDYLEMPDAVIDDFGFGLYQAQKGDHPFNGKVLKGFGGARVIELVEDHQDGTFRCVYSVRFDDVLVVLHVFQKKSKKGKETPKPEIDLIRSRLKLAEVMYENWKKKRGKNG
jgi:phage-related protein